MRCPRGRERHSFVGIDLDHLQPDDTIRETSRLANLPLPRLAVRWHRIQRSSDGLRSGQGLRRLRHRGQDVADGSGQAGTGRRADEQHQSDQREDDRTACHPSLGADEGAQDGEEGQDNDAHAAPPEVRAFHWAVNSADSMRRPVSTADLSNWSTASAGTT